MNKDKALLDGIDYAIDIGYAQYKDRKPNENKWQPLIDAFQHFSDTIGGVKIKVQENETRLYNCGGLPVEVTLPEGEHGALQSIIDLKNSASIDTLEWIELHNRKN